MYKKFFSLLFLMAFAAPAQAYKIKTFKPLAPPVYQQALNPLVQNPYRQTGVNESYPKITQLEFTMFRRTYEKENIYSRLTRLENRVFRRSFSGMPLATRVDNLLANIDPGLMYGITSKELAKLEMKVLGRTYNGDDTDSRITRLEKEMLGAMQGGNLKQRYETVKTASKHYNSYPELAQSQSVYPQSNYGYRPYGYSPYGASNRQIYSNNGVNGILQKIAGAFFGDIGNGSFTGMTPPIYDPYNRYGFASNPAMGQRDEWVGNTGAYINNRNIGSGSTVHILD